MKESGYRLMAEGAVIGLITGALISMFRLMLTGADRLRDIMVSYAGEGTGPVLVCALMQIEVTVLVAARLIIERERAFPPPS